MIFFVILLESVYFYSYNLKKPKERLWTLKALSCFIKKNISINNQSKNKRNLDINLFISMVLILAYERINE